MNFMRCICLLFVIAANNIAAQNAFTSKVFGKISCDGEPVQFANVGIEGTTFGTISNAEGAYQIDQIPNEKVNIVVHCIGYETYVFHLKLSPGSALQHDIELTKSGLQINEVTISGNMKETDRMQATIPIETYSAKQLQTNPTCNIFDAMQNVNGVRPQFNCNICNTGDIHINGMEGPYTLILIDGMPIVSSLSSVYGLSGIPTAMIERVEVVKGPASSLYGSDAMGGLINIISKKTSSTPLLALDLFATSWEEVSADVTTKLKLSDKVDILNGISFFDFKNRVDNNQDNFTDIPLQSRISFFQKWQFQRNRNRLFSLAGRYLYEDRFGGEMQWQPEHRGGDDVYGESIYTSRWELIGSYQLPFKEIMMLSFSLNDHLQNSAYGLTSFHARQKTGFAQLHWNKTAGAHTMLAGASMRYISYDDNTPVTQSTESAGWFTSNEKNWLPGLFIQDDISFSEKHHLLLGLRAEYQYSHGEIFSPRLGYRFNLRNNQVLRLNAGKGFRVVNVFTEDHAALTGAREVILAKNLNPEQSQNINLNYFARLALHEKLNVNLDFTVYYSYFDNRIIADYDTDPNKIIYNNLNGNAINKGISANIDVWYNNKLRANLGATVMDNSITTDGQTTQQILTENFTGVWGLSYKFVDLDLAIDYTGNIYSPMRLPLSGALDPRSSHSPWWSIQNIQMTYSGIKNFEFYCGVKNILDFTPKKGQPFIISRSHDPFDKLVEYDQSGQVMSTPENPYALTFDPTYVYGPNQGIRFFVGIRYLLEK
jgi:outer membrane receptor for ferrienterochelin and colicins